MAVDLGIERLIGQDQTIRFCYGGEGEIRTPDSLSTMPDFESGVVSTTTVFTTICGETLSRCYLECHINLRSFVGAEARERSCHRQFEAMCSIGRADMRPVVAQPVTDGWGVIHSEPKVE